MQSFQLSTIGTFHTNHNEDALIIQDIDSNKILFAIADGCSMGKESHFAAHLFMKLLKKFTIETSYQTFAEKTEKTNEQYLLSILQKVFTSLQGLQNQLSLATEELLCTLMLGILDQRERSAKVFVVGDGLIVCNGVLFDCDQENKPDYLAYHLKNDFETWYAQQRPLFHFSRVQDLSLASDGIFSFRAYDTRSYPSLQEKEIIAFFLQDTTWTQQANMLHKKRIILEKTYGLKPSDDLSIIRIIA